LLGNRANHAFIKIDVFDLDVGDFDAPVVGALIENVLNVGIQFVALSEHVVELMLTQHRSQSRL